eukprot:scaffold23468_cov44-Attheya_sp.AAC.2
MRGYIMAGCKSLHSNLGSVCLTCVHNSLDDDTSLGLSCKTTISPQNIGTTDSSIQQEDDPYC